MGPADLGLQVSPPGGSSASNAPRSWRALRYCASCAGINSCTSRSEERGKSKGDACLQVSGVLRVLGSSGAERRGRCVGLRVQRTGSLRHACFPLPSSPPQCLSGRRVPADVVTRTPSALLHSLSTGGAVQKSIRLEASGDYPPNLSISLSGGKEINRDLLSSGERTGASPALNRGSAHAGREMWGEGLPAHPRGRGRAPHVEASARRPRTPHQRG